MKKASELLAESAGPFDEACMLVRSMEAELERLRKVRFCADRVCAVAGAYGQILGRDDRLLALMDALHEANPK